MLRMRLSLMRSVLLGSVDPKHSLPCSFRPFGLLCFSSASYADEQKSRAFAAAKTIEYLCNIHNYVPQQEAQGTQKFLSTLLVENLQQYPAEVSQDTIEEFRDLFDPRKGIKLPNELKKQDRIIDAEAMKSTGKKFSFFPNRLVVAHLFPLLRSFQKKTIVIGKAGISKTTAIILFTYLSGIVSQYQYERGQLQGITEIPKLFYLNYSTEISSSQDLMYLIKKQCPYVEKEDQPTLSSFTRSFSDRQIQTKVVIDQFNALVRQVEELNSKFKDDSEWIQMNKQIRLWKQPWQLGPYLYNSSINIEERIFNQRTTIYEMGLDLNHHSKIDQFIVPYEAEAQTEWGQKEILRFMVFEALKYADPQLTDRIFFSSQGKCEEVELINGLWDSLKSKGIEVLTHLTTREHFASKQNQIKGLKNIKELKVWLIGSAEALRAEQIKQLTELVDKFAKSDNPAMVLKKVCVSFAIRQRLSQFEQSIGQKRGVTIPISELDISQHLLEVIFKDVSNHIDKNLLRYDATQNQLVLMMSPKTFLQVTSNLPQMFSQAWRAGFQKHTSFMRKLEGVILGVLYENILTEILRSVEDNPIFTINVRTQAKIQQQELILVPQISTKFIHLNNKKENLNGKTRMGEVLKEVGKGVVYADPKTIDQYDAPTSASMDFIIAKRYYDGQQNVAKIYSFDVACGKTINQIKGKANKAQKKINEFLNEYEQSADQKQAEELPIHSWEHHILCCDFSNEELDYQPPKEPQDNDQPESSIPLQVLLTASSQIKVKSNNKKDESIHQSLQLRVQNVVKNQEKKKEEKKKKKDEQKDQKKKEKQKQKKRQ